MTQTNTAVPRFSEFSIASNLLAQLDAHKFTTPTPIQHQVIPVALEGKDVIGIAQTGTGKTLAFGIPMIQRLGAHKGQGLIILPTRELALQVDEVLQKVGRALGLRTTVLIGGAPMPQQKNNLKRNPHIVIATPGRLMDHLKQKSYSLDRVKVVVLDEADRMFDIGFAPQIKQVMNMAPKERQTMLFSATMPPEIAKLAAQFMTLPLRIEVAPAGTSNAKVEQEVFIVRKEEKMQLLDKLLSEYPGTVLVFSRTKFGAKRIAAGIRRMNHTAVEIHSNRSLSQRKAALEGFKSGKFRVMVATDIAARGIDVKDISLVINFDLPDNNEDYVHRIGRTGRGGSSGKAISFATAAEKANIKQIEKLIRKTLPILNVSGLPAPRPAEPREQKRPFNSSHRQGQSHGRPFKGKSQTRQRQGQGQRHWRSRTS